MLSLSLSDDGYFFQLFNNWLLYGESLLYSPLIFLANIPLMKTFDAYFWDLFLMLPVVESMETFLQPSTLQPADKYPL